MPSVSIKDKVVFVTGSNRGIGKSFVTQALEMGAKKVYATARDKSKLEALLALGDDRIVPVELDVTKQDQVDAAAAAAGDVEVLINNSGMGTGSSFLAAADPKKAQLELNVNYLGMLRMAIAFAPILKANGGGAMVNILSISSLTNFPFAASYSASKAAAHSLTQGLRVELDGQGTLVTGVYPGPIDTDMAANLPYAKESPDVVAVKVFEAIAAGDEDVFPDAFAVQISQGIKADAKAVEKMQLDSFKAAQK